MWRKTARLIPARAGNTRIRAAGSASRSAHPRSRGEHWKFTMALVPAPGSSPLARGTHFQQGGDFARRRLIPARAGNTAPRPAQAPRGSAHPRSRGEHISSSAVTSPVAGSSPLARGTHVESVGRQPPVRLIPARAGNTANARIQITPSSAHPRSRGEHATVKLRYGVPPGSSPLARGTRFADIFRAALFRLIPARAGNTSGFSYLPCTYPAHPRSRGEHRRLLTLTSR